MTPVEKAKELVERFSQTFMMSSAGLDWEFCGKLHAKMCCNEILGLDYNSQVDSETIIYWEEVKTEIEKL